MLKILIRGKILLVGLLAFVSVVAAQGACAQLVQSAFTNTADGCFGAEPNSLCYGNGLVSTLAMEDADTIMLSDTGDTTPLDTLASIRTTADVITPEEWGIALMQLGTVIEEEPVNTAQLLFFGNTDAMQLDPPEQPTVEFVATGSINVRAGDSTNDAIVGSLSSGNVVEANGRNALGEWIRFLQEDGTSGWVYVPLMSTEDEIADLPIVEGDAPQYSPMQIFNMASSNGLYDSPCDNVPHSGLLMQTAPESGALPFIINGVSLDLSGTAYIVAEAPGYMFINVLEGEAQIIVEETTLNAIAGSRTRLSLNVAREPIDVPVLEAYALEDVANLPLAILSNSINTAESLSQDDLASLSGEPQSGIWLLENPAVNREVGDDLGAAFAIFDCNGLQFMRVEKDTISELFDVTIRSREIDVSGRIAEVNDDGSYTYFYEPVLNDNGDLVIAQETWFFDSNQEGRYIYEIATRDCGVPFVIYTAELSYELDN